MPAIPSVECISRLARPWGSTAKDLGEAAGSWKVQRWKVQRRSKEPSVCAQCMQAYGIRAGNPWAWACVTWELRSTFPAWKEAPAGPVHHPPPPRRTGLAAGSISARHSQGRPRDRSVRYASEGLDWAAAAPSARSSVSAFPPGVRSSSKLYLSCAFEAPPARLVGKGVRVRSGRKKPTKRVPPPRRDLSGCRRSAPRAAPRPRRLPPPRRGPQLRLPGAFRRVAAGWESSEGSRAGLSEAPLGGSLRAARRAAAPPAVPCAPRTWPADRPASNTGCWLGGAGSGRCWRWPGATAPPSGSASGLGPLPEGAWRARCPPSPLHVPRGRGGSGRRGCVPAGAARRGGGRGRHRSALAVAPWSRGALRQNCAGEPARVGGCGWALSRWRR